MRFQQQRSKQYVCQKEKRFVIFGTKYRLHRLVMMSQLKWIPSKFGQVSYLMWIFSVGQADCPTFKGGFYDVYSNDRKTPKDCPDTFYNMLRGLSS